jgi:hypothetical protein
MQQRVEAVKVRTVPSTYVSAFNEPLESPYRRVVGLKVPGLQDMWSRVDSRTPEAAYSRDDTACEELMMPAGVSCKLGRFFSRYFVEPPRMKVGRNPEDRRAESYNCHRFGYWMRGALVAGDFDIPAAPDHIVEMGRARHPLAVGVHGVVGLRDDAANCGSALHSVIGLGADSDECLQVLATSGFMGIDSYKSVLDWYQSQPSTGNYQAKIYY